MRHTISVLVENKFGVLTRVTGLFSGRGYNIDTLNVAPTQDPSTSSMTIVTRGDDATLEQIVKQLNKLVNVLKVQDFREGEYVDRELVLVKVSVDSKSRAEVRSEEHTSELQSRSELVCRLLLEKKKRMQGNVQIACNSLHGFGDH